MVKTSHVVAAFLGCLLVAWVQFHDPDPIWRNAPGTLLTTPQILWTSLFFGLVWECILRLPGLLKGLLARQSAK